MTETKQLYRVNDPALNRILQSVADRLDRLEGLRNNPEFYSETFEFPIGLTENQVLTAGDDEATFAAVGSSQVDHNLTNNYDADEHIDWTSAPSGKNMDLSGRSYLIMRRVRQADQPTPTAGELIVWSDSDDDTVYLVYNDADGGVKQVQLT